jgi:hypothetical protein
VVGDLALIMERTFNCREQLRMLNALLRQLTPPTKGTPDYVGIKKGLSIFTRASLGSSPKETRTATASCYSRS